MWNSALVPAGAFGQMERVMRRMDDHFGGPAWCAPTARHQPAWSWSREDDGWTLEVELPGFSKDDVELKVDGRLLTVTAEQMGEMDGDDEGATEILRHRSLRVRLPPHVDTDAVQGSIEHGLLTMRLPRATPEPSGRRILLDD